VVPANLNAPGQIVLSGSAAALDRALASLVERGVKRSIRLPVSVPSHSPLMRAAAARLAEYLKQVPISAPRIPVIHNADVSAHSDPDAIRAALALQLHAPVRWIETVEKLAAGGATRVLECGPGKVLVGMVKRIAPAIEGQAIGEPAGFDAALEGLRA
jgi:[acyl-carrier-protein] S-malonyltransferase